MSFGAEKLSENFNAIMGAIVKAKPAAAKGQYIKSCVVDDIRRGDSDATVEELCRTLQKMMK